MTSAFDRLTYGFQSVIDAMTTFNREIQETARMLERWDHDRRRWRRKARKTGRKFRRAERGGYEWRAS